MVTICTFGDQLVMKQCQRIFKSNKRIEKGVAFPTCVSVNNVVCHNSPLPADNYELQEGDVSVLDGWLLALHFAV